MDGSLIALVVIITVSVISREFYIHIQLAKLSNDVKWIKRLLNQHYNSNPD